MMLRQQKISTFLVQPLLLVAGVQQRDVELAAVTRRCLARLLVAGDGSCRGKEKER